MSAAESATFKRKYPRRLFTGTVGVLYRGQYMVTQARSLGEGGMSFFWPSSLPIESGVVVTFKIPGDEMISLRGEIRNSKKSNEGPHPILLGIQFLPLPIGDKRRIRAFISARTNNEPFV
ncbi:MAG: hypothetical protein RJB66_2702 [Pseudomonadota bacterium]|jgi:hypothetical protein